MKRVCNNCQYWIEHWKWKGYGLCGKHEITVALNKTCDEYRSNNKEIFDYLMSPIKRD